jgi:hypothetical protein
MASEHSGTSVVTAGDDTSGVPSRAEAESSNPPPTDGNIGSETEASTATTAKPTTDGATTEVPSADAATVKDWTVTTPAIQSDGWEFPEATIVIPGDLSWKDRRLLARVLPMALLAGGYVWRPGGRAMKAPAERGNPGENREAWYWWDAGQKWVYPTKTPSEVVVLYSFDEDETKWMYEAIGEA